ncbi:MAG TPA: tetratricopeptide repeat protein [Lacipirellulaceae bacterium]|nr:tetratricopeptide repeat protein [Lacipirellulaceae bacterium]
MYVLGVVKAHEADQETSIERRAAMYLLAARYLQKARTYGVPEGREANAAFLVGKCLASGGQSQAAIPALRDALQLGADPALEIHSLLAQSLIDSPDADLEEALRHLSHVTADPSLSAAKRERAWLLRGESLLRLGRHAEAEAALMQVQSEGGLSGRRMLLLGRLKLEKSLQPAGDAPDRASQIGAAIELFSAAAELESESAPLAREAIFWLARCYELLGDSDAALVQYRRLTNLYGDTAEGLAATLAEADYARIGGENARALSAYRAGLQAVGNVVPYDNPVLPLPELRTRLLAAFQQFVSEEKFADALTLSALIEPVLGRVECTEQRARTLQQWGARRRDQALGEHGAQAVEFRREGRLQFRAAGRAYEDLSRMRYATRYFTRDLWAAADCYFQGQSYSNAARMLEEYLHHESRQWNSHALVRLGQARLARGEYHRAVNAFEECIEVFPREAAVYQARLEAARAYQLLDDLDQSERALRTNLAAGALTPASPEWRDSLFELGRLLFSMERYAEAVDVLDEAVRRYPSHDSTLLAKYMIARAHHNAAQALEMRLRRPSGENETQINIARESIQRELVNAHAMYLEVQQTITLQGSPESETLTRTLLRNCYMMQGTVLMELRRFEEARQAYQNVISLYQNDPVVLESFVQVANCWRRLDEPVMARGNLERAKVVLSKLPEGTDFLASTNFTRQQWVSLLNEMSKW